MSRTNERHAALGAAIMEKRIAMGWSRQQIATKIGVTHQQFQKYEKGTNRVDSIRLEDITKIFKCKITDFFEPSIKPERPRASIELVRTFNELSPEAQQMMLHLMVGLKNLEKK